MSLSSTQPLTAFHISVQCATELTGACRLLISSNYLTAFERRLRIFLVGVGVYGAALSCDKKERLASRKGAHVISEKCAVDIVARAQVQRFNQPAPKLEDACMKRVIERELEQGLLCMTP